MPRPPRQAAATAPSGLPPGLLITAVLPTLCPACGWRQLKVDERAGGWFKVTCLRGDERICTWSAGYEVKSGQ